MQAKPDFRKNERFGREFIIQLGVDLDPSPYYAVSCNLSPTGMYFKSLFELYPEARIFIRIDDYTLSQDHIPARVVWCEKLESNATFRYGVGVEFLRVEKKLGLVDSLPAAPQAKTPRESRSGVVISMRSRPKE
jgi:hypothetical protein